MLFKAASVPFEKASRLLLVVIAAPALGDAGFGGYQFATTVTMLLMLATELGLGVWTTRALARDPNCAAAVVGTAIRVRGRALPLYAAGVALVAYLTRPGDARTATVLLGAVALVNAAVDYMSLVFRGFERMHDEALLNVARAFLICAAGAIALFLHRSVSALAAGLLVGTSLSAGYGLSVLHRRYRLLGPALAYGFDRPLAKNALSEGIPLWIATLFSLLYFRGDVVLLRWFAGDAEVGVYSAAYKIFEGLMVLPSVVMAATFPPLARAFRDRARQRRWELLLVVALVLLGMAAGALVYTSSDWIVASVYGRGYVRSVPSLRILSLALPVLFLNYALTHFLIARNLERYNLAFTALMLLFNVGANLVAIPRFGGPGAAWVTLLTEVVLTISCTTALVAQPGLSEGRPLSAAE